MANSYLQFSIQLEIRNEKQKQWLERYLPLFDCECEGAPELLKDLAREAEEARASYEGYKTVKQLVKDECCQSWSIERGDPEYVWFYAEESGEPEMVLAFIHIFMARFGVEGYVELTWAAFCDKLRLDEFGGGAGFACAEGFDLKTESWWVKDAYEKLTGGKE